MEIKNVLSLFDGISCGQVALNKIGIKYENYFASEIDKNAIKIAKHNFPEMKHLGDITKLQGEKLPNIDLLIGGSPCQSFSIAGKKEGFNGKSGLFYEYLRLLKETHPTYFLLENVVMKKEWEDIISEELGIKPIKINSALLSAQNRQRLYWTNIPGITQPEDKQLFFKDIEDLEHNKYRFLKPEQLEKFKNKIYTWKSVYRIIEENKKVGCLTVQDGREGVNAPKTKYKDTLRYLTALEWERLQTLPDNYTNCVTSDTVRRMAIGNGWTVDIIAHIFSFLT